MKKLIITVYAIGCVLNLILACVFFYSIVKLKDSPDISWKEFKTGKLEIMKEDKKADYSAAMEKALKRVEYIQSTGNRPDGEVVSNVCAVNFLIDGKVVTLPITSNKNRALTSFELYSLPNTFCSIEWFDANGVYKVFSPEEEERMKYLYFDKDGNPIIKLETIKE